MISAYKYARALFESVVKEDALDEVIHDFETFYEVVKKNEDWIVLMNSPAFKWKDKEKMLASITGLHPVFYNFLVLLSKKQLIGYYHEIYEEWLILARKEQSIANVRVVVAKPLSYEQILIIRDELSSWIEDMEIEMEIIIDKRLLGGIRFIYQGQTIDRSFSSELQELKSAL